jgi:TonB-dependent Receptor Plug Domain
MRTATLILGVGLVTLMASPALAQKAGKKHSGNRNVLTAEEIASRPGATTAYDLVVSLRPNWLITRGVHSGEANGNDIVVYVDGVAWGGPDQLDRVRVDQIQEMRFLSAGDATMKYGTGNPAGAIEITTKH